ncbi:Disease resistance protein RPV1 [Linum perenne]
MLKDIDNRSTETTNTSFPTPPLHNYDVFLSFQGSEVRGRFVDYLYSRLKLLKVNTFMDHMMLPKGELIEESVNLVIQQSKIFVIVLSLEYVNSPWCLDELVKVVEKEGHVVVPVFFHVSPRDVCNQDGVYGEAFWRELEFCSTIFKNMYRQ